MGKLKTEFSTGFNMNSKQTRKPKTSLAERLKKEFEELPKPIDERNFDNTLILGENNTIKSGSVLEHLLSDLEDDEKIFIVDIDASNFTLIKNFHLDAYNKGQIIYYDPYTTTVESLSGNNIIDYKGTTENCKAAAEAVRMMIDEGSKIRGILVDGISLLLTFAEYQMRDERGLDADDGANLRVFKLRSKIFNNITTMFCRLEVPVFFVAHEDFMHSEDGSLAAAKSKLHGDCTCVIHYSKVEDPKNKDITRFNAKILKNRNSIISTNKSVEFATVNNNTKTLDWNPNKPFDILKQANDEAKVKKDE